MPVTSMDRARWRQVRVVPGAYDRLRHDYREGHHQQVLAHGDATVAELNRDPATRGWVPGALLLHGAVLAGRQELPEARRRLDAGLSALPGSDAAIAVGRPDRFELMLLEVLAHLGEFAELSSRLPSLTSPERAVESRLAATRMHALLCGLIGDTETAHQLLNTASGLAQQVRGRLWSALVVADRASLLASEGRIHEAVRVADSVLEHLASTTRGSHGVLAREQAVITACVVARAAGELDDPFSAARLLTSAESTVVDHGRPVTQGHVELTRAVVWRTEGRLTAAARAARHATQLFADHRAEPARAAAVREQGHVALASGYLASARPALQHALDAFTRLGMPVEQAATARLLRADPLLASDQSSRQVAAQP